MNKVILSWLQDNTTSYEPHWDSCVNIFNNPTTQKMKIKGLAETLLFTPQQIRPAGPENEPTTLPSRSCFKKN